MGAALGAHSKGLPPCEFLGGMIGYLFSLSDLDSGVAILLERIYLAQGVRSTGFLGTGLEPRACAILMAAVGQEARHWRKRKAGKTGVEARQELGESRQCTAPRKLARAIRRRKFHL